MKKILNVEVKGINKKVKDVIPKKKNYLQAY